MKAPVLGLLTASLALAGSSLYLWQQLRVERERSAQVQETTRQLEARLAEFERTRQTLGQQRQVFPVPDEAAAAIREQDTSPAPPMAEAGAVWSTVRAPEQSAVAQKVIRSQIRAANRRMYAHIAEELGLSQETTNRLIDIVTDQQTAYMGDDQDLSSPQDTQRRHAELEQQHQAALAELLGPEKLLAYQEYQESLPARSEFEAIAQQLEGNDLDLTPEQRKKLMAIYIAERNRVPQPVHHPAAAAMSGGETFARQLYAWQEDYMDRVSSAARPLLNDEQRETFDEYQQWQKDMRSQLQSLSFEAVHGSAGAVAVSGNSMMFRPAAGVVVAAPVAPAPPSKDIGTSDR
jgi:hypothetical protein